MRKRLLVAVFAGVAVFGVAFAFAAALNLGSNDLASGDATVSSCDTNGVTSTYAVTYTSGSYRVSTVNVTGIDAACAGQSVGVTLTDTSGGVIGTGSATADASGAVAASIAAAPSAAAVTGVHAVIHGA